MSKSFEKTIKEIIDPETGEKTFQIKLSLRSEAIDTLRLQRQVSGFKTPREAERAWPEFFRKCLQELNEREIQGESFGALVDEYELASRKETTMENSMKYTQLERVATLREWALGFWKKPAKEITPYDILQALQRMRDEGRSQSRINNFKSAVNRVYQWGIYSGFLKGVTQSPAVGVSLKREPPKKQLVLTEHEIKFLLKSAKELSHPWFPVWAMALLTGMRNGELYALLWTDIDLDKRQISVTKSYSYRLKETKCTKSGEWRTVPINDDLLSLLKGLRSQNLDSEFVLPRLRNWHNSNQAVVIKRFCLSVGLPLIRFHDLRACFATSLLRAGVVAAQVMKVCGWEDLETMQRYIRLSGIDVSGSTDSLKLLPEAEVMARVISMDDFR